MRLAVIEVSSERARDESEENCCAKNKIFYHGALYCDYGVIFETTQAKCKFK